MSIISRLDILPHSHFVVMFNIVATTTEGEVRLSPLTTTKTINIAPFFIAQDPCKNITSKSGLSSNSSIHSPLRQRFLEAFHEKCTGACLVGSVECTCLIDGMHWNNGWFWIVATHMDDALAQSLGGHQSYCCCKSSP